MLFCAVTLNFSVLSPEAALMQFDEVPFDTPVQSLVEASAALLGVAESDISIASCCHSLVVQETS